jgi:hypothetical protein
MLTTLRSVLAALSLACMGAEACAGDPNGVVVELFTSQGCVSCPPADAFLVQLAGRPGVIALSQHVDYWNYLGWTDPFSNARATARQHAYRDALKTKFVYTPQMVIDGSHELPGSERERILSTLEKAQRRPKFAIAVSHPKPGTLRVVVPAGSAPEMPASVWLVLYTAREMTTILTGENRGVVLTNANVVREMRKIGTWTGAALTIDVPFAELEPQNAGGCAIVVQLGEVGRIVGAIAVPVVPKAN